MSASKREDWAVKAVKTFIGNEGYGFNANLYLKGKRVAFVYDDASGGPVRFQWADQEAESAMTAFCATQPPKRGYPYDPDFMACELVDEYEDNRTLRRHCKTKVMFRLPDDPEGEFRSFKSAFTKWIVARIRLEYGAKATIVNFRFGEPK